MYMHMREPKNMRNKTHWKKNGIWNLSPRSLEKMLQNSYHVFVNGLVYGSLDNYVYFRQF